MEEYSFNIRPEDYQPSGCADFSKIYMPGDAILTYTNLNTGEKEVINIPKSEITDENGITNYIYILPPFFDKNKNKLHI